MTKMTTSKVTKDATRFLLSSKYCRIVMPNIFFYDWEADAFGVTRSSLVHEIEVKTSKGDFVADFRNKKGKHYNTKYGRGANYFWFAVPHEMLDYALERIPEYAGLLSYKYNYLQVLKNAPILHKNKMDPAMWEDLAIKLFHKKTSIEV